MAAVGYRQDLILRFGFGKETVCEQQLGSAGNVAERHPGALRYIEQRMVAVSQIKNPKIAHRSFPCRLVATEG